MDAWRTFFRDLSAFIDGIAEGEHRATANVDESVVSRISNYQCVLGAILTTIQSDADLQGIATCYNHRFAEGPGRNKRPLDVHRIRSSDGPDAY